MRTLTVAAVSATAVGAVWGAGTGAAAADTDTSTLDAVPVAMRSVDHVSGRVFVADPVSKTVRWYTPVGGSAQGKAGATATNRYRQAGSVPVAPGTSAIATNQRTGALYVANAISRTVTVLAPTAGGGTPRSTRRRLAPRRRR